MKFEKTKLTYEYKELEPSIDALTVETHYEKHHTGYQNTFNNGIKGTELENYKSLIEIMNDYKNIKDELKPLVRNAGGGLINHDFYWNQFALNREITQEERENTKLIKEQFGKEEFYDLITSKGLSVFGSGWVWLVKIDNKLEVITTPNQENPWMQGINDVVLGIDLWEHAYYLNYKQDRKTYIENVLNLYFKHLSC